MMKKQILNLEGVVVLTKQQQKAVNGGSRTVCTLVCQGDNGGSATVQNCSNVGPLCPNGPVQSCSCTETNEPGPLQPRPKIDF